MLRAAAGAGVRVDEDVGAGAAEGGAVGGGEEGGEEGRNGGGGGGGCWVGELGGAELGFGERFGVVDC